MSFAGGCYCHKLRYEVDGDIVFKGQCHCRECQYISGGGPNMVIGVPEAAFSYIQGTPTRFSRTDLENPVTREFCPDCGTHILTLAPGAPGIVILKVGTLDDPSLYDIPDHVIWTSEKQAFHHVPEGVPAFEKFPVHE